MTWLEKQSVKKLWIKVKYSLQNITQREKSKAVAGEDTYDYITATTR